MPDAPFNPRVVLDAAAMSETGVTLHFETSEAVRAFQIKLSVARRAEQKKLALSVKKFQDMLNLTGWENIVTRTLESNRLWVGVKTLAAFGIARINGMNGA